MRESEFRARKLPEDEAPEEKSLRAFYWSFVLLFGLDVYYKDGNYDCLQYHDFICGRFRRITSSYISIAAHG